MIELEPLLAKLKHHRGEDNCERKTKKKLQHEFSRRGHAASSHDKSKAPRGRGG
jgi:hypothetical protein